MKYLVRGAFFLFLPWWWSNAHCLDAITIHKTNAMRDLLDVVHGGPGELVIFDIDYTLLIACDERINEYEFGEGIKRSVAEGKPPDEAKSMQVDKWTGLNQAAPVCLVDRDIPWVRAELIKKNIRLMALTSRTPIPLLVEVTFRQLHDLGLEFPQTDPSWSKQYRFEDSIAENFRAENSMANVIYAQGVLFSDGSDKGNALAAFFEKTGYVPKHLIFIDDSLKNVLALARLAEQLGIQYDGFHFTRAQELIDHEGFAALRARAAPIGCGGG